MPEHSLRDGMRAIAPLLLPGFALAVSFGVLAQPVMGAAAAMLMSASVFAGGAQFASTSVLESGGTAAAAIAAGLLMNARFIPMSFAVAPSLHGGRLRRAAEAQSIVDPSFVVADAGGGRFARNLLVGSALPQYAFWIAGTAVGVALGATLPDPGRLGFDAIFPAFYLGLLVSEARGRGADRTRLAVIVLAAAITLTLMPVAPAGIPVIAASAAALLGLSRR